MKKTFLYFIPFIISIFGCFPVSNDVANEDFDITTLSFSNSNLKIYINSQPQQSSSIMYSTTTQTTQVDTSVSLTYAPFNALNKNISWSISNKDVLSFSDEGTLKRKISVKNVGSSQITATATTLKETTLQANMTVNCYYVIEGFSINKTEIPSGVYIRENQTYQLSTTFTPSSNVDTDVSWGSSKTAIATVNSSGLVTGVTYGNTYISAKPTGKTTGDFKDSILVSVDYAAGSKKNFLNDNIELQMHYVPKITSFPANSGTSSVTQNYWVAETEVTKELWDSVTTWAKNNGYSYTSNATASSSNYPISNVSWKDAIVFCNALTAYCNNKLDTSYECYYKQNSAIIKDTSFSLSTGFDISSTAKGFRLPTVAEWELAAMYIQDKNYDQILLSNNGEATDLNWASGASSASDVSNVAWYSDNSGNTSHPVKSKNANALRIYDMSGNLWEWCYSAGSGEKTRKGGSYEDSYSNGWISIKASTTAPAGSAYQNYGFRVVKNKD